MHLVAGYLSESDSRLKPLLPGQQLESDDSADNQQQGEDSEYIPGLVEQYHTQDGNTDGADTRPYRISGSNWY